MDATCIESQPLLLTKLSTDEIKIMFYCDEQTNWKEKLISSVYDKMIKEDYQKILNEEYLKLLNHRQYLISVVFSGSPENNINYPIHFQRLITTICGSNRKNETIKYLSIDNIN